MIIRTACEHCGEIFDASSFKARYCSDAHRKAASRARKKAEAAAGQAAPGTAEDVPADSSPADEGFPLHAATLAELQAHNREASALGLAALYLAQQIDMLGNEPGALAPQLVAQHAQALARALGNAAGPGAVKGGLADIIGGSGGLVAIRGGRS